MQGYAWSLDEFVSFAYDSLGQLQVVIVILICCEAALVQLTCLLYQVRVRCSLQGTRRRLRGGAVSWCCERECSWEKGCCVADVPRAAPVSGEHASSLPPPAKQPTPRPSAVPCLQFYLTKGCYGQQMRRFSVFLGLPSATVRAMVSKHLKVRPGQRPDSGSEARDPGTSRVLCVHVSTAAPSEVMVLDVAGGRRGQ